MNDAPFSAQAARDAVKYFARELGFSALGVCSPTADQGDTLRLWVELGAHAGMSWMERHVEARLNPRLVLPEVRSVIMLSYEYASEDAREQRTKQGRIARYAQGEDYHLVLKPKLADLDECLQIYGGVQRCFSDSGPVSERFFAQQAGLGWIGKNGMLIREKRGSYAVLASILTTLELPRDEPAVSRCGSCQRCLEVCPTQALDGRSCDARRCLSYWTIEAKEPMPATIAEAQRAHSCYFGCDLCQEVCPWNSWRQREGGCRDARMLMPAKLRDVALQNFSHLDEEAFAALLHGTALRRAGVEKLRESATTIADDMS